MALDANIPILAGRTVPDVGAAIDAGINRFSMLQELQQQREEAPIRKQLLQQQAELGQQAIQAQKQTMSDAERKRQIVSVASGAQDILGDLESGNFAAAEKTLERRLEDLTTRSQEGQPDPRKFQDTLEALNAIKSGDANRIKLIKDGAKKVIEMAESQGLIEPRQGGKRSALQQGTGDLAGFVFDPNSGVYAIDPNIKAELDRKANIAANKGEPLTFKDKQGLNKDVTGITKKVVEVHRAAEELGDLEKLGTPAAKLGAVFKFMKALDPTSVVRETEQGQVYAASGAAAQLAGSINSLLGEGKLTDEGFKDLVVTARTIANSNIRSVNNEVGSLLDSFGDSIDQGFSSKVKNRIPSEFNVKPEEATEKRGGTLHIDANGNKAIVFPDGSYKEVN